MVKKIGLMVALMACGGEPIEPEDLGSLGQPYVALNSTTRQWGTRAGTTAQLSCNKTTTSQVCTFAKFKNLMILVDLGDWIPTELDAFGSLMFRISSVYGAAGWNVTFGEIGDTVPANTVPVTFNPGFVSQVSSSDIIDYRSVGFGGMFNLTEGQGGGTPVAGQYKYHASCNVVIDVDNIVERTTPNNYINLFEHAAGNALTTCMGVGNRNDIPGVLSQRFVNQTVSWAVATSGEVCRASYGDEADKLDFSIQNLSSCTD